MKIINSNPSTRFINALLRDYTMLVRQKSVLDDHPARPALKRLYGVLKTVASAMGSSAFYEQNSLHISWAVDLALSERFAWICAVIRQHIDPHPDVSEADKLALWEALEQSFTY